MTIYLVRHAAAGDRGKWDGPDWIRPLTDRGRAQARGVLEHLKDATFARIVSSAYVRCTETTLPVAAAHSMTIEINDALAEGADVEATLALLKEVADDGAVLCSHGDMIPAVLDHLAAAGLALGPRAKVEKGSVWVLETRGGSVCAARYLPPLEA